MYIKLTNSTIHIQKLGKKDKEHEGSKGEREGKRIWEGKWEEERKRERKPAGSQPASQQAVDMVVGRRLVQRKDTGELTVSVIFEQMLMYTFLL